MKEKEKNFLFVNYRTFFIKFLFSAVNNFMIVNNFHGFDVAQNTESTTFPLAIFFLRTSRYFDIYFTKVSSFHVESHVSRVLVSNFSLLLCVCVFGFKIIH